MKKLRLKSNTYKKFFEISDKVMNNRNRDISLMTLFINFEKLVKLSTALGSREMESYGRGMHYMILDNIGMIGKYLDNSQEVKNLSNTFVGVFEILEILGDSVLFLDTSTNKKYTIIGEGEGNQFSLEDTFSVGDILISRLIKLEDGWYNMKSFYFLLGDNYQTDDFKMAKIEYKTHFKGIKNLLEVEEIMYGLNVEIEVSDTKPNINYLKRIRQILLKSLGKKTYKNVEKLLKNKESTNYEDILEIVNQSGKKVKNMEQMKEYILEYLKA